MSELLRTSVLLLLLLSAQIVVSQSSMCGRPVSYPNKRLLEKYAQQTEFKDGERVVYRCAVGYYQTEGIRMSYCKNGQWESLNMTCTKKICGSAGDIENGRYEQEGNSFGDKAYATCKEGYVLQGEGVRECLDNGWSGTIPTCVDSHSSLPPSRSSPPLSRSFPPLLTRSTSPAPSSTEIPALTCQHPTGRDGTFNETKTVYKPGESLSFSCNVGFQPNANISIKCQPTGTWSPRLPICIMVECPELKIPNSRIDNRSMKFNTTVKVTCEDGFQLKGTDLLTCAANSSWSPAVPTCGSGQCDQLPLYPNALPRERYLSLRQFESGAVVRFKCPTGYRWAGGNSRIHCENGRWTSLEMRCEKKQCGSAGEVTNGHFHYTGVFFGDTATAVCNEGYKLIGVGVRRCQDKGWDGRMPVCEVVQCPPPEEVPGAEMSEPADEPMKYRHVVSYRCLSGTLVGEQDIYCTEEGTWSAPPPQCRDVSCPNPSVRYGSKMLGLRPHYKPGHQVMFTCKPGFKIRGSERVFCGINGNWMPELPKCVPRSAA